MSKKVLDFLIDDSIPAELWDESSPTAPVYVQGIAHADMDDGTVRISFYRTTGLTSETGDIAQVAARFALSRRSLLRLSSQFSELCTQFSDESESRPSPSTNNAKEDEPSKAFPLGPRVA
jgi:hypothetical protein